MGAGGASQSSRACGNASGGLCRLSEALTLRGRRENERAGGCGCGASGRRTGVRADVLPRFVRRDGRAPEARHNPKTPCVSMGTGTQKGGGRASEKRHNHPARAGRPPADCVASPRLGAFFRTRCPRAHARGFRGCAASPRLRRRERERSAARMRAFSLLFRGKKGSNASLHFSISREH